ncbi:lactate dehydrogenase [Nitrosopumilus sp. K4]|uniref:malate dehydrogenase n=1 Tax=Nitrosopumilus sp. K4 TaxID=2795383 RepID=UPI001BA7C8EC|nr:lactate dehydrogenase [Nitrosopumilus sp. K4]QUC65747.1 lactate dehydrogenase [Nitrosopumilus sp. K4]
MISIIGSGRVGASIAFLCASNSIDDILLVNRTKTKAVGEALDISNAIPENSDISIHGTDDYSKIVDSKIVVITASTGVYLTDRTEMIGSQVKMIKEIASKIKQYCPDAIVLMVSNPLDVLTYFFQKESKFPRTRVIGIASSLDTSRFRYFLSEKFDIKQSQISDAIVLGEHGNTMVPIFSHAKIDGNSSLELLDLSQQQAITKDVREYWKYLRNYKSRSQFGIAKNTFDVIYSILKNKELNIPASVLLEGEFSQTDVSMGVPVIIDKDGISKIYEIELNDSEKESLKKSAQTIRNYIKSV